jgi:lysosomal acid lipase/cholesteryl ester hydrolase
LQTLLPIIVGHTPAGTSTQTVIHYAQGRNSGKFQKFDFGAKANLRRYNSSTPPVYDVGKITVPVVLMWAQNDNTADPQVVGFSLNKPHFQFNLK